MSQGLIRRLAPLLTLLLAACGGGGSHTTAPAVPAVAATATPAATATARLTLTIPARGILARRRSPQFVSPSTAQAVVVVNSGTPQNFSLSTTGPNCTTASGGAACVLNVAAPIGPSVTFRIVLEDLSANVLSGGSFTAAIAEGASNVTFPIRLGGVPKTLDITSTGTLGTFFTIGGGAQTSTLVTNIKDIDGDFLIGNEPFVNASGVATPISVTSATGTPIAYATAPFGQGFGAAASTFTLNAPSDAVEMQFNGTGVPPGFDTLTFAPASVVSIAYGNNTPNIGIGAAWQAGFVPLTIAPIPSDVALASAVQHSALVTDGTNQLAVVGQSGCTVPSSIGTIDGISSIALDGGASPVDGTIYTIDKSSSSIKTGNQNYSLESVATGDCTVTTGTVYSITDAVGGVVRAGSGKIVYYTQSPVLPALPSQLESVDAGTPTVFTGGIVSSPVGALALRAQLGHIFACGNGNGPSNIAIEEYEFPLSIAPAQSSGASASSGTGQTSSCAGVAVDGGTGRAIVADIGSNVATRYGTFPISLQVPITLTGSTIVGTQSIDFQSAAAGNWHGAEAFFISTTAGIEVYNQEPPITQQSLVHLGQTGLGFAVTSGSVEAIAYGDDSRLWITLSSGYVIALPTY